MSAILVKANGDVETLDNIDYKAISNAVGGYIEVVYFPFPNCKNLIAFINEEGKLQGLEPNAKATLLWHKSYGQPLADFLVGDVVFLRNTGSDHADLTDKQKKFLFKEIAEIENVLNA